MTPVADALVAAMSFLPLTVSVLADAAVPGITITSALDEASAIWRPLGLESIWRIDEVEASSLRVIFDHSRPPIEPTQMVMPIGSIKFEATEPRPEIHLSYDNAMALLSQMTDGITVKQMTPRTRDVTLGRALGRALAHELGHYLLASKAHTPTGLMRSHWPAKDLFAYRCWDADVYIDPALRNRIADRIAQLEAHAK